LIVVDSSVWIDYFRGAVTAKTDKLDSLLVNQRLAIGDPIVAEVLQGFERERDFNEALDLFDSLLFVTLGGSHIAPQAAVNYRKLRALGVTVRKTIACIIATRCIEYGYELLHNDQDFKQFVKHLGLQVSPARFTAACAALQTSASIAPVAAHRQSKARDCSNQRCTSRRK